MKSTGIVRRVDELGRIVLPIEMRRTLDIAERDSLEIYVDGSSVVLKKYAPSCIFCNDDTGIHSYRGKNVCINCLREMAKFALEYANQPGDAEMGGTSGAIPASSGTAGSGTAGNGSTNNGMPNGGNSYAPNSYSPNSMSSPPQQQARQYGGGGYSQGYGSGYGVMSGGSAASSGGGSVSYGMSYSNGGWHEVTSIG